MSASLIQLLHLSDSTLPIGAFSHSAGLETYVQRNIVHNKETALEFITEMLGRNLQYTDAALLSLAYDAAKNNLLETVIDLDEECSAVKLATEVREASKKLGKRLLKIYEPTQMNDLLSAYIQHIHQQNTPGNYCIVFGIIANALGVVKEDALSAFCYNAAAGFVTNCVKLIPLGQQDGQEMLFSLHNLINKLAQESMAPQKDMIGFCCTGFDIKCMQHEQLYSRLYMS